MINTIKNALIILIITISTDVLASDLITEKDQLSTIQHQVLKLESLVDKVGIDKISKRNLQKAREIKVLLSQIKAEPMFNKTNFDGYNKLYNQLGVLLNPNNKPNILKSGNKNNNPNSLLSGIVTNGESNEALYGFQVILYDINGNFISLDITDSNGRYFFRDLIAGTYYIIANRNYNNVNHYDLITTAYPSLVCEMGLGNGCQLEDLTSINLSDNQSLSNIDIEVIHEPLISGQIYQSINTNNKISQATIILYDLDGTLISVVSSSNSSGSYGEYQISAPPGDYYMVVKHSLYHTQLFENISCNINCDLSLGTPVSLQLNQAIDNFNFGLELIETSSISGTIVDKETQQFITDGDVYFLNTDYEVEDSASINFEGVWSNTILPIGEYKLVSVTDNYSMTVNYLATIHDSYGCSTININDCDLSNGLIINHDSDGTENLFLQQIKGAKIRGRVLDSSNQPLSYIKIKLFDTNNNLLSTSRYSSGIRTDPDGYYEIPNVGLGSYYVLAEGTSTYQGELYPNSACTDDQCDFSPSHLIAVNNFNSVENIDFNLVVSLGTISGRVTDASNNPIDYVDVKARFISNSNALLGTQTVYTARTNSSGYYTFNNLPIGDYQIYAYKSRNDPLDNYLPQSYSNYQCSNWSCYDAPYLPIQINNNYVESINFQLKRKGIVNFNLISNSSNQITEYNGGIRVEDSSGNGVDFDSSSNNPRAVYLDEGDYYFSYSGGNFVSKIYGGENCNPHCNLLNATLVHVDYDSEQTLTMNLDEYFYLDLVSYNVLPWVRVYGENSSVSTLYSSNSSRIHIRDTSNKKVKFFRTGYIDQLFNGINCINDVCNLSDAETITPIINTSLEVNLNMLEINSSISGVITDSEWQGNKVELHTSLSDTSIPEMSLSSINGSYSFTNVAPGNYYLKVLKSPTNKGATTYYGDIACENNCESLPIPSITLDHNELIIGIDVVVTTKGSISGEGILDANQQPATFASIKFYNLENDFNTASYVYQDDNGVLEPVYLPEGSYKLIMNSSSASIAFPNINCEGLGSNVCKEFSETIEVNNGENFHFTSFLILDDDEGLHQTIEGTVQNALSNELIEGAKIKLLNTNGTFYEAISDENGHYRKLIPSGSYHLFASGDENYNKYISQLYNEIECDRGIGVDCLLSEGTPIYIDNTQTSNINFNLNPKPRLLINVINEFSGEPLSSSVNIFDSEFRKVDISGHDHIGVNHIVENLNAGSNYYIIAKGAGNYQSKGYPNILCNDINSVFSCQGELMPVNLNSLQDHEITINSLLIGGINGYVSDAITGIGVGDTIIDFWSESGYLEGSTVTTSTGQFSFRPNTINISYYLSTDTNNGYINEVYNNIQCEYAAVLGFCDLTQGELIHEPYYSTVPIIVDIELNIDSVFSNGFD